ncbi:MAG: hypothetical protein AB7O64_19800 [Methylibium sp.]
MRARDLGRRGVLAILFVAAAAAAAQSARLGASGFHAQLAHPYVERWAAAKRAPGAPAIAAAESQVRDSLRYAPANPEALGLMGALALAKMRAASRPQAALDAAREARSRYRDAVRARPTSPFLWANLALAKLYLDEFDAEMSAALRHADALGPWESAVQRTTVFVGLAGWQRLDAATREVLAQAIGRAGLRDASGMLELVKSYQRLDLVCAREDYRRIAGAGCGSAARAAGAAS